MRGRQPARQGLSYVDANKGRLITVDSDVSGVKAEIESRWPSLRVVFDTTDEVWVIYQVIEEGPGKGEYFVADTDALDSCMLDRLDRADPESRNHEEAVDWIDRYNENLEKEQAEAFEDRMDDAGERLAHALRKDGLSVAPRIFVGEGIPNR